MGDAGGVGEPGETPQSVSGLSVDGGDGAPSRAPATAEEEADVATTTTGAAAAAAAAATGDDVSDAVSNDRATPLLPRR